MLNKDGLESGELVDFATILKLRGQNNAANQQTENTQPTPKTRKRRLPQDSAETQAAKQEG